MKLILILCLVLSVSLSWAQIESESSVRKTITNVPESQVKDILIHEAVQAYLEQNAAALNIDYNKFNTKLQERFQSFFEVVKKQKFAEKFGANYASELSEEQKKSFLESIELQREEYFRKFARYSSLLNTYAFKSLEKDNGDWKATIVFNLSKDKVEKMNRRLSSKEEKQYSRILLVSEITPIGFSWPDLDLEKSAQFSHPLAESWVKWAAPNMPENIEDIVACEKDCLEDFNNWLQLPQEENLQVPAQYLNSLWLKVSFTVRKLTHKTEMNEWMFEWEGSVILLDANTKLVLASYNLPGETKSWRGLDQKALNSALASAVYKSALDSLNKVMRNVRDSERVNQLNRLIVQGHANITDVLSLMELLKKEGSALHLSLKLDVLTQKEVQLLCFYRGEEKSFTNLLSRLKELKSSQSYTLVNEFTGVHHVLKLVAP